MSWYVNYMLYQASKSRERGEARVKGRDVITGHHFRQTDMWCRLAKEARSIFGWEASPKAVVVIPVKKEAREELDVSSDEDGGDDLSDYE